MSYEDQVKERHKFEDRLKLAVAILQGMTERELEVAIGRLADMRIAATKDEEIEKISLKGHVEVKYLRLAQAGNVTMSKKKRKAVLDDVKERRYRAAASVADRREQYHKKVRAEWEKGVGFIRRFFAIGAPKYAEVTKKLSIATPSVLAWEWTESDALVWKYCDLAWPHRVPLDEITEQRLLQIA